MLERIFTSSYFYLINRPILGALTYLPPRPTWPADPPPLYLLVSNTTLSTIDLSSFVCVKRRLKWHAQLMTTCMMLGILFFSVVSKVSIVLIIYYIVTSYTTFLNKPETKKSYIYLYYVSSL